MTLEYELNVFRSHLAEWLGHADANEGRYAIVKGDEVAGPFPDYETALGEAYKRFGLVSFLVKRIERVETVLHFTRDLH